jgi:dTDP-4-amino-4,6-dideoxygalactose transaminase
VHLFGRCADMDAILSLADKHKLFVLEDSAQSLGSFYRDRMMAGTMGVAGCYSFFPSKNLGAMGDAGLVVTNNADLYDRLLMMRSHGAKPKYFHSRVGGNFRIDALQAAILKVKLPHLNEWSKQRIENADRYRQLFKNTPLLQSNDISLPLDVLPPSSDYPRHIYNQFIINVRFRDRLIEFLKTNGVGTEVYYPRPLHLQECFSALGGKQGDCPLSEAAAGSSLAIPVYPGLTSEQQRFVVELINRFYQDLPKGG